MRRLSARREGLVWLCVTAFGWGFNWPVLKVALAQWPAFSFRLLTSAGSVALLLGLAGACGQRIWPQDRREWGRLALFGLFNVTSFVGLGTLSLLWLDASEATIVAYTMPIWASLLAWPVLGERPTPWRMAGLALGLGGVAVLVGPLAAARGGVLAAKLPGFVAISCTALLFAFGAVLAKRMPTRSPPMVAAGWQIALGTLPLVPAALIFDHWAGHTIHTGGWLAFGYVAVIALGVAYLAWFRALDLLPAATAAIGTLMVPVVGVLSAGLMLGEGLGTRQLLALAMTLAGVALALRGR